MKIQGRIAEHGGISAIHVTPVTDTEYRVVGWQNVIVCADGHREHPTLAEQEALATGEPIPKGFSA